MLRSTLLILTLLSLTACPATRDGGGGEGGPLDDLDTDGDGELTAADLATGEGGIVLTLDFVDEDGEADPTEDGLTTTDVRLEQTFSAWNLAATFGGAASPLTINLRFELEGDLAVGTWDVSSGSASPDDDSWYAYGSEAGGQVEITNVGDGTGSGHFSGTAELDVLGEFEEPTGEVVRVTAFAFRDVETLLADM